MSDQKRLFVVAVALRKTIPDGHVSNLYQGYRFCITQDEAIGSCVRTAQEWKPDFSLDQVIAMEIPEDRLRAFVTEQSDVYPPTPDVS